MDEQGKLLFKLNKWFWEKWWVGIVFLWGILGVPTFIIGLLQEKVTMTYGHMVFIVLVLLGLCWGLFVEISRRKLKEKSRPAYCDYISDIFDGCKYQWVWDYDDKRQGWRLGRCVQNCLNCNFQFLEGRCKCENPGELTRHKSRQEILTYIRVEIQHRYDTNQAEIY